MLVIHPEDRTTTILQVLYKGLGAQVVTEDCSNREIGHLLHHTSTTNRILLLGHGSNKGLYYREDDTKNEFDKIIVDTHMLFIYASTAVTLSGYGATLICSHKQKAYMAYFLA